MEPDLRYHPSTDQLALAITIEESLQPLLPISRLHTSPEENTATWSGLEDIGIFGVTAREEDGGSGLGAVEEALIATVLGRQLASPSVFATMGAAHARPNDAEHGLRGRRIAAGFRNGERVIFLQDEAAELVLVRGPAHAAVYATDPHASRLVDDRLWLAGLREYASPVEPIAQFDAAGLLRLRLIDAAALAGISAGALDMAVRYAGTREQFSRPIGSFQAVKHHCANMAISANCARDQVSFAAVAIDDDRDDAMLQVESALWVAGCAAMENAAKNIQIHGGIGFSDEADPHLYLKRARLQITLAGGFEAANRRIADVELSSWQ